MVKESAQDDENYLYSCKKLFYGRNIYPFSQENIQQVKDKSTDVEIVNIIFGERSSQE